MSISDSDYQGRFTIPTPKGVYQAAGDTNINTDYAYRAENIRTERGLLAAEPGRTTRTDMWRRQAARFTPTRWERKAG